MCCGREYYSEDSLQMVGIIAQCPLCTLTACSHHWWQALFQSLIARSTFPLLSVSGWAFMALACKFFCLLDYDCDQMCTQSVPVLFVSACVKVYVLYWSVRNPFGASVRGHTFSTILVPSCPPSPSVPVPISTPYLSPTRSSLSMWRHSGRTLEW